jgi:hypothetical protein
MDEFDATILASTQKSNDLDVYERHTIEIQRNPRLITFYLRPQFIEMLRPQPSAQANNRLSPIGILFNLQWHLRFLRSDDKNNAMKRPRVTF